MNTKNIFLSLLVLAISALGAVSAQEKPYSFELRGGVNFTKVNTNNEVEGKQDYRFDAVVDKNLTSHFFLRSGLTFSARRNNLSAAAFGDFNSDGYYDFLGVASKVPARYLQLPVMAGYRYSIKNVRLSGALGGYVAYGIGGKTKSDIYFMSTNIPVGLIDDYNSLSEVNSSTALEVTSVQNPTFKDIYKRFDSGLTASLSAEFKRITVTGGYEFGLVNYGRDGDKFKNRTAFVSLGYRIY